jgi:quercetin dioxygenase-like cupin family protein
MKIFKMKDMIGGWFVGNFEPSAFKTENFEVCYKKHPKNDVWDRHYHKEATEINYLVKGKIKFQNKILESGDIFVVYPWEISDPEFLEDTEVVIVKTPSVIGDKYNI